MPFVHLRAAVSEWKEFLGDLVWWALADARSDRGALEELLADVGTLYLARQAANEVEVLAIQTVSPSLARTAWPMRWRDNRRTDWLTTFYPRRS